MLSTRVLSFGTRLATACVVFAAVASSALASRVLRVACVGDSITAGVGVEDRQRNAYPARLGQWLGKGYYVRNFGVSGATLLHRGDKPYFEQPAYTSALQFAPDIVVIDLGTNDSKHPKEGSRVASNAVNNWQYHASYVADYEEMIGAFRKVNPAVKAYVCIPTPAYPGRWGIDDQTIREEVIPLVRQVAKDSGAKIIDLYKPLSGKAALFPDTVHPNAEGANLLATEVFRALVGQDPPSDPGASLLMNRRVLWLGDSITQDGKYVSYVQYFLEKSFPRQSCDFVSIGLSSETVSGLSEKAHPFPRPCVFERLQRALDAVKPATVVACYGMNDGIYHPQSKQRMQAFEDGIHRLSLAVQAAGAQLILLTPPPFDPLPVKSVQPESAPDFSYMQPFVNYDSVLGGYSAWEKSLPNVVVDLHTPLESYLAEKRKTNPSFSYSTDGIHPSAIGHLLMAQTLLHAVGVEADGRDLEAELNRIDADPLFQSIREQREKRSAGWLDFVGYTRGNTVKTNSVSETEKVVAELQTKIDALRS